MAFRKTLAHRFLHKAKAYSSQLRLTACPTATPALLRKLVPESDGGLVRRFLHKRPIPPDRLAIPMGDGLIDRIRAMNGSRIRLDGLAPPPHTKATEEEEEVADRRISMVEVRKVLKAAQMEMARSRLRSMGRDMISHHEFLELCNDVSSSDQGPRIAKALDESGAVIVLGNVVFLRPDQVAKVIRKAIPLSVPNHGQHECREEEELREMEQMKAAIDKLAEAGVKKELWGGLGFMVVQTIGLMRLTFWDLSWDVMEPICFYLTSAYFLAGYGFFLRTSKEPSFESFFQSRLASKQKRLMKAYDFDPRRFDQLKRSCKPQASEASGLAAASGCDCMRRNLPVGIAH